MAKSLPKSPTLLRRRLEQIEEFISFFDRLASHLKGEYEYHHELLTAHTEGREVDPCQRTRINPPNDWRIVEFGSQARDLTQHFDEAEWNCVITKLERAQKSYEDLVRASDQVASSDAFEPIAREIEECSGQKPLTRRQRNEASWTVARMCQCKVLDECRVVFAETVDYLRSQKARIEAAIEAVGASESTPTGFLGGAELADALGVHSSRRDAFFELLRRQRLSLGDECWYEVTNPRPHSPHFLYRPNSDALRKLAARYKTPKPA